MGVATMRRSFSFADRERSIYQYLDFEVDSGSFSVTLDYPDDGVTIFDLGMVGPDRFRGWSGGERRHVSITEEWATPGYLPGTVSGHWQVVLGLYRVPVEPVEVVVTVDDRHIERPPDPAPIPVPERPPGRDLPTDDDTIWLRGDLHSHTVHSDGKLEIDALLAHAVSRGLDFVAVTDHNTVSHHPYLEEAGNRMGMVAIPGQEVTTDVGHANCLGEIPWVDFREPADTWRETAEENGGLMSVNHPWAGHVAWRKPLSQPATLVEMWHHTWDRVFRLPFEEWQLFGRVPVGGSDFHRPGDQPLGDPTTWVEVNEPTVAGLLDGLGVGRVCIGANPSSPLVYARGDELVVVDGEGCELVDAEGRRSLVKEEINTVRAPGGAVHLYEGEKVVSFTPGTRGA
ncbi:MAG: PHP domain-containing protein [Acidimicrobiia bacterium]|nr:PHP domain-containing protein [Acidimicrobiia bacterium]